jgi:hypothetical protein
MKGGCVFTPPGNIAFAGTISNILKNVACGKGLSYKVIYRIADKRLYMAEGVITCFAGHQYYFGTFADCSNMLSYVDSSVFLMSQ